MSHSGKIRKDKHTLGCFDLDEAFDEGQDVPLLKLPGGGGVDADPGHPSQA